MPAAETGRTFGKIAGSLRSASSLMILDLVGDAVPAGALTSRKGRG
jgi:hypothetical protein